MRKSLSVILVLLIALLHPTLSFAQEAKITDLTKGQKAPFNGVLFNTQAAAKIMADQKFAQEECQLKIDLELEKLQADLNLQLESTKVTLKSNEKKYQSILQIKDEEIKRLTELALESEGDYKHWWAMGGFVSGALITVGIFYLAAGASK